MEYVALKEICSIKTGKLDANRAVENGKYPFFTCAKEPSRIDDYAYDCDCVLLAGNGEFNLNMFSGKFNAYQRTYIIETNNPLEFPLRLIYYTIKYNLDSLKNKSVGGIVKFIKLGDVQGIKLSKSILLKKDTIISTLDLINDIIEKDKEQIKMLDELNISKFIEMFGDPILNDKKLPVKKLKELSIKITNGNTPKGGDSNYIDNGIMFLRSQNVLRNSIDYSDVVYISKDTSDKMKGSVLKNGDILITKTGRYNTENSSLGRPAIFEGEDDSANINGHVYLVRLNETVNKKYILSILLMPQFKDYIRKVCVGGTDKRQLNKDHIEDFPILFPHIDKQNEFANFFEQINNMKEEINNHLKLMNELLNKKMEEFFGGE